MKGRGTMADWSGTPRQISELAAWVTGEPEHTWWWRAVSLIGIGVLLGLIFARGL